MVLETNDPCHIHESARPKDHLVIDWTLLVSWRQLCMRERERERRAEQSLECEKGGLNTFLMTPCRTSKLPRLKVSFV